MKKRNKLAKNNSACVSKSIHAYTKKHKRMPSLAEISTDTGLSRQAVSRHLQELKLPDYLDKYKEVTDDVMECLLDACKSGNVHAIKLYFQMVWRWKPPKIDEATPTNDHKTNYIILTGNEAVEHTQSLEKNTDSATDTIPLNRKIQHEKEEQINLDSGFGVSDAPSPFHSGWSTI